MIMVMVMNDNNYKFGSSFSIQSTNTMLILFILLIKDLAVISYETHFYYALNLIYKEPAFECCKIFFAVIVTVNYLHICFSAKVSFGRSQAFNSLQGTTKSLRDKRCCCSNTKGKLYIVSKSSVFTKCWSKRSSHCQ